MVSFLEGAICPGKKPYQEINDTYFSSLCKNHLIGKGERERRAHLGEVMGCMVNLENSGTNSSAPIVLAWQGTRTVILAPGG